VLGSRCRWSWSIASGTASESLHSDAQMGFPRLAPRTSGLWRERRDHHPAREAPRVFTPKGLAEFLALSERTVRAMLSQGDIPSYMVAGTTRPAIRCQQSPRRRFWPGGDDPDRRGIRVAQSAAARTSASFLGGEACLTSPCRRARDGAGGPYLKVTSRRSCRSCRPREPHP
jgi:excisionase family DNA binding protein